MHACVHTWEQESILHPVNFLEAILYIDRLHTKPIYDIKFPVCKI